MTVTIAVKNQTKAQPGKAKLAKVAQETLLRRRAEHFRFLGTIAELLPREADIDGHAKDMLNTRELAAHAGVSGKAVTRALQHWQRWRVLWLYWKGSRTRDIRFERRVVEDILTLRATEPRKVVSLLKTHRKHREEVAPRRGPEGTGLSGAFQNPRKIGVCK